MVDASGVRLGADRGAHFSAPQNGKGESDSAGQFAAALATSRSSETAAASRQPLLFQDEKRAFNQAVISVDEAKERARHQAEDDALVEEVEATVKTADDEAPAKGRSDQPAGDGTFGKRDYTAVKGDTLERIAADYGQSVDDLLLANPQLSEGSELEKEQVIAVYDGNRLAIAKEMAATTDLDALKDLVRKEILYATGNSATPSDLLPYLKAELLQRRGSDDPEFPRIVSDQSAWALDLWKRQGRTHEVMDRLQRLTERGDRDGLMTEIQNILRDTAINSPTFEALQSQIETLLQYGPKGELFANAVSEAADILDYGKISEAAQRLAEVIATRGPVVAADLLAQYTSPDFFDPISASLLLYASSDTISAIISYLGVGDQFAAIDGGMLCIDMGMKAQIFSDLSKTINNTSDTPIAANANDRMAYEMNVQIDTYNIGSMASFGLGQTIEFYGAADLGQDNKDRLSHVSILRSVRNIGELSNRMRQSEQEDAMSRSRIVDTAHRNRIM